MDKSSRDIELLSEVIGRELTVKVMAALGGINIYIPRPGEQEIKECLRECGYDAKKVAARLNISQRKVYRVLKTLYDEQPKQRTLFDL